MDRPAGIDGSFWRAITVFRIASLCYAALLLAGADGYQRPIAGWLVFAVMVAWTAIAALAYPDKAGWPLLTADLLVTTGCVLAAPYAEAAAGTLPVTATWVAGPVLAWSVHGGRRAGIAAAVALAAVDTWRRGIEVAFPSNGVILLLLTAVAVGHVARLARRAEEQLRQAARTEAASRERERLARGIHDSVLQVLAMVQRRGGEIGGAAAELGRLAGEQEAALRELVRSEPAGTAVPHGGGLADLTALLRQHSSTAVTVSSAADPLLLPADQAGELTAAVRAALDNVRRHGGPDARAWVFAEKDGDTVTVTVRDDGCGIADGRLEAAAAEGRLGVAQSIRGRMADLGGTVRIVSGPGQGTEIELEVPAARPRS